MLLLRLRFRFLFSFCIQPYRVFKFKLQKQAKMSDYYMLDELLTKILMYLPTKSLVRFTCVCKSWYSLITSSDFITDHLNNNDKHILILRYHPRIPNNERMSLHVDNDTFDLYKDLDFPFESSKPECHVYGSCNGLILLSSDNTERRTSTLMLWNPSIRKSLTLPRPRFMYSKYDQTFGFGFDSRTNDYKVVRLVYRKSNGNVSPKVELFRLSTRSWEPIKATFDPSCFFYQDYLGQVFMNGRVHWSVSKMGGSIIMSFNMSDEEFSEIMPPPATLDVNSHFKFAVWKEWLSLFYYPNFRTCSIWAMKEYGVVESWTNLYTLDLLHLKLGMPLGLRKNGELLLKKSHKELLSYHSETQQIKYLGSTCRPTYCSNLCIIKVYVDAYVESLVLLVLGAGPTKQPKKKRKNR